MQTIFKLILEQAQLNRVFLMSFVINLKGNPGSRSIKLVH